MEDNGGCCLPCINSKSMFSPIYDILSLSKMKTPMLSSGQDMVTIFVPFVLLDFKTFNNRFVSDFKKDND